LNFFNNKINHSKIYDAYLPRYRRPPLPLLLTRTCDDDSGGLFWDELAPEERDHLIRDIEVSGDRCQASFRCNGASHSRGLVGSSARAVTVTPSSLLLATPTHLPSVGINRRLLLGSTVGSCCRLLLGSTVGFYWDRPSAQSPVTESTIKRTNTRDVGVRRSSVEDVLEIDRKLQGELC
jgi:hypothetical protein